VEDGNSKQFVIVSFLAYEAGCDRHPNSHCIWFTINDYRQKAWAFIQSHVRHDVWACLNESFGLVLFSDGVAIDQATTTSNKMFEPATVKAVGANASRSVLDQSAVCAFL
jgi:hypothetical protein